MTVARVAGAGVITRAMVEHWVPVEDVLLYEELPARPVPPGVVPDPPGYSACVAFLRASGTASAQGAAMLSVVQGRLKCHEKEQKVKQLTVNVLINWYWTLARGAAAGLRISDREVRARLAAVKRNLFPVHGSFAQYLKRTEQTMSDMLFRARVQLIEVKLQAKLQALQQHLPKGLSAARRRTVLLRLAAGLVPSVHELVARTTCQPGYVTSDCREYDGNSPPGTPN